MLAKIRTILIAALLILGSSIATGSIANAAPLEIASSASANATLNGPAIPNPSPSSGDETVSPRGPWWPEVDVYVGCNNVFSFSGAAWDLKSGAYYTTSWDLSYTFPGGPGGSWSQNTQNLKASSSGFLTTSTFYGTTTNYSKFSATMYLYKNGQEVGHHTTTCYK